MTETQYGIVRDLLRVPHRGGVLVFSYPAFGVNTYANNIEEMQKQYSHSVELPVMKFRPATTSESISAAAYRFGELAKPEIFDTRWLHTGYITRTSDGVFTNTQETDENVLKKMLNKVKPVNGIYLIDDKIAFAPYESFRTKFQDSGDFAEGGLARALEHTEERTAPNLREIASSKFYPKGVCVLGFDIVKQPIVMVARLGSIGLIYSGRLNVYGNYWDNDDGGYVFGVPVSAE